MLYDKNNTPHGLGQTYSAFGSSTRSCTMAVLVCIHGSKWDRVVQMWAMMAGPSASSFSPKRCSMMAHICSTLSPFNCVTPGHQSSAGW